MQATSWRKVNYPFLIDTSLFINPHKLRQRIFANIEEVIRWNSQGISTSGRTWKWFAELFPLHSWFVTDPRKVKIKTGSHQLSPLPLSILLQSGAVWQVYNKMLCLISVWCVVTNKLREQPTAEETNFSFLPLAHSQYHCHQPSSPRQSPLPVEVLLRTMRSIKNWLEKQFKYFGGYLNVFVWSK